ncbi:hypothetical protein [Mammaliicoccus sciuri]|nr:hypothetical protein [Mammaliicoccus sciuri]
MNNILFIGNGFDIDHCMKIQDLKNISTYEALKNEVRNKNLYI